MNQVTGTIVKVAEARNFTTKDGRAGWSQEIILDCTRKHDGKVYPNSVRLEYSDRIDSACVGMVKTGARVTCSFDVEGFFYEDKASGEQRHMQRLQCYTIAPAGKASGEQRSEPAETGGGQ